MDSIQYYRFKILKIVVSSSELDLIVTLELWVIKN